MKATQSKVNKVLIQRYTNKHPVSKDLFSFETEVECLFMAGDWNTTNTTTKTNDAYYIYHSDTSSSC